MNRALSATRALAAAALALALASCSNQTTSPVVLPDADSIAVSPHSATVTVGATYRFTVTAWDSAGNPIAAHLVLQSSNPAVFTVDASARISARSEGVGVLRVWSGAAYDSAIVVVNPLERGWYPQGSGVADALNDVYVATGGRAGWAVGGNGRIVATTDGGATWAIQASGTANVLNGVWFTSASEGWAVGKTGTALHTTNGGANWTKALNLGTTNDLEDVQFATRDTGWVVGAGGVILRTLNRGGTWTRVAAPNTQALHALSFAGTLDGWAVGDGGVILGTHDRGLSWYTVTPFVTTQSLHGVWRVSATRANAVGASGATARATASVDSLVWTLGNAGGAYDLRDVCFATDLTGFAAGTNGAGAVLRTDDGGAFWTAQAVNTGTPLNAVFFTDALHGWAVGENGVILHTATGGQP